MTWRTYGISLTLSVLVTGIACVLLKYYSEALLCFTFLMGGLCGVAVIRTWQHFFDKEGLKLYRYVCDDCKLGIESEIELAVRCPHCRCVMRDYP